MSRRPVQQRAEADRLLLAGVEAAAVAEQLGLPPRTVRRWAAALAPEVRRAPAQSRPAPPPRPVTVTRADHDPMLRVVRDDTPEAPASPQAPPDPQRAEELVEAAVGRGWGLVVRRQLAAALGLAPEEVDGLRARSIARAAAGLREPDEDRLAEFLLRVRWSQGTALKAGDLGALTRLLSVEARVAGLDRLEVHVEHSGRVEHGLSPDELLERRRATWERLRELGAGGLDS